MNSERALSFSGTSLYQHVSDVCVSPSWSMILRSHVDFSRTGGQGFGMSRYHEIQKFEHFAELHRRRHEPRPLFPGTLPG